jgi:hypothetical protein
MFNAKKGVEFIAGGTLAGSACFGDSGGPAYVQVGQEWRVLGITSGAIPKELWEDPDKACGNGSKTVRVEQPTMRAWISEGIARLNESP